METIKYEDALKKIGFGRVQIETVLITSILWIYAITETFGPSFIVPAAKCDLNLSSTDKGLLTGITFLGIMTSSHFWGYLSDTKGRRKSLLMSVGASVILSIISVFISNFWVFLLFRFFVGFCVAGYSVITYAFMGEFNTPENRAVLVSYASISVGMAMIYVPGAAWWILSYNFSYNLLPGYYFKPWRALLLLYEIPGIISFWYVFYFEETPKYYLTQGKSEEALKVLKWIYRKNKFIKSDSGLAINKLEEEEHAKEVEKGRWEIAKTMLNQTMPLFRKPNISYFFILSFIQFGIQSIKSGMGLWFPEIINQISNKIGSDTSDQTICGILASNIEPKNSSIVLDIEICDDTLSAKVFIDSMVLGVGYLAVYIILGFAVNYIAPGKILVFNLLFSGTCGMLLLWVGNQTFITILYCCFLVFCGVNVGLTNTAAVNLFPTYFRSMSVALAMLFGRLGSVLATNLVAHLLEQNCELTFGLFSGLAIVSAVLATVLPFQK